MIEPPRDYPVQEDQDYMERVAVPLALGMGLACFYATHNDLLAGVAVQYEAGKTAAIDPDPMTRAREAVRAQMSARVEASAVGFEAVVR